MYSMSCSAAVKTLFGVDMHESRLPALLFSDEALMQLVGLGDAQHVRQGMGQRGAAKRQGERYAGRVDQPGDLGHMRQAAVGTRQACSIGRSAHLAKRRRP